MSRICEHPGDPHHATKPGPIYKTHDGLHTAFVPLQVTNMFLGGEEDGTQKEG